MGGVGSGRWAGHRRAIVAESCEFIDLRQLRREGRLRKALAFNCASLSVGTGPLTQTISLVPWNPRFGGKAWWMICPMCRRRCVKLFRPPHSSHIEDSFRCRLCWGLTYQTAQTAHRWDRGAGLAFLRSLARESGISLHQARSWWLRL